MTGTCPCRLPCDIHNRFMDPRCSHKEGKLSKLGNTVVLFYFIAKSLLTPRTRDAVLRMDYRIVKA